MAIRPIVYIPDPVLRQVCDPVDTVDETIRTLLNDMVDTMHHARGIGLASPQIGETCRVIVMAIPNDMADDESPTTIYKMVNPTITAQSEDQSTYEEGCLSIPDGTASVTRPASVTVDYLDEQGKPHTLECDGILATCVQHEIDHLNGVLYFDHVSKLKRDMIRKKTAKWIKSNNGE